MDGQKSHTSLSPFDVLFPPWLHFRLLALGAWTIVRIRQGLLLHHHESRATMSAVVRPVRDALRRVHGAFSLELQNEGSVARDHLASERTFLAWLRTSLSLVSIGM